jgi:hypothetical protein
MQFVILYIIPYYIYTYQFNLHNTFDSDEYGGILRETRWAQDSS